MPSRSKPLRQMLFRQRGAAASVSPDDWSPLLPPLRTPSPQQLQAAVTTGNAVNNRSWNNTEADDENFEAASPSGARESGRDVSGRASRSSGDGGGGGGSGGGGCNAEQRDRLAKCQKSLEQLEFSLNNLLLNMSLASASSKNRRRMEQADRFFTDLVDSIRANRSTRRRRNPTAATTATKPPPSKSAVEMRRRLEEENRALWRAQHIGAKCEDTVDRYMLDVVIDQIGQLVAKNGGSDQRRAAAAAAAGGGGAAEGQPDDRCGKCGGATANRHNSSGSCSRRRHCREERREPPPGSIISFPRRLQQGRSSTEMTGAQRDWHRRQLLMQLNERQQQNQHQRQLQGERQHQHQHQHRRPHHHRNRSSSDGSENSRPVLSPDSAGSSQQEQQQQKQHQQDRWTLRTWQPAGLDSNNHNCSSSGNSCGSNNSNNNNCGCSKDSCGCGSNSNTGADGSSASNNCGCGSGCGCSSNNGIRSNNSTGNNCSCGKDNCGCGSSCGCGSNNGIRSNNNTGNNCGCGSGCVCNSKSNRNNNNSNSGCINGNSAESHFGSNNSNCDDCGGANCSEFDDNNCDCDCNNCVASCDGNKCRGFDIEAIGACDSECTGLDSSNFDGCEINNFIVCDVDNFDGCDVNNFEVCDVENFEVCDVNNFVDGCDINNCSGFDSNNCSDFSGHICAICDGNNCSGCDVNNCSGCDGNNCSDCDGNNCSNCDVNNCSDCDVNNCSGCDVISCSGCDAANNCVSSNNNNCGANKNNSGSVETLPHPRQLQQQHQHHQHHHQQPGRRATDLLANVAAYRRDSERYEKALRVAAYLRDLCREFYRTSCSGRAPPAAQALESAMSALAELVAMRDRLVGLAVRCTACPALCPAERVSGPQLCRLRRLLRLACTKGDCAGGAGGALDLNDALAAADSRPDRCRLLRRLRQVAAAPGRPDADYRRLINALASLTELDNCASNYAAHRRRMCGTAPPLGPGPRGVSRADMRALAIDIAAEMAEAAKSGAGRCSEGNRRGRPGGDPASSSSSLSSPLTEALHNPEELRRRLRMHQFATGASLAVKAEEGFRDDSEGTTRMRKKLESS